MRTRTIVLFSLGLALAGCGGGGHHGSSSRALPGPTRLRFFNGSSQSGLGLAANGTALVATGASSANPGEGVSYESVADGNVDLAARTNGGQGADFATSAGATFATDQEYTAFAYGAPGSGGMVLALDTADREETTAGYAIQVVDLLDASVPRYAGIYQNGQTAVALNFQGPGATGFGKVTDNPGSDQPTRFTIAVNSDGTTKTPVGAPFAFTASDDYPVTVVIYGSASKPKYAVLQGVFFN